ncbi:MAG: hypothetical protein C5B57_01910 [Blastocatellia bacterium]|nr:MAG: hypothetical protein C5B57_01910 [Blastocatellia bacterium]
MTLLRRGLMRWLLPLVLCVCGCIALTPKGMGVSVYRAPLDGLPAQRSMPAGCRLLFTKPPVSMPELDLEGQKDPFRVERNEAGAAGGNALLVLTRMTMARHNSECPTASPITDCPPSFGAWFRVVIESYACNADALDRLAHSSPSAQTTTRETLHP